MPHPNPLAAFGGDDALNADLLESLHDTGMYNFASEFDMIQDTKLAVTGDVTTMEAVPSPSGLPGGPVMGHDETTYQGLCSGVEGRSAVKTEPSDPGSSFRGESPAGGLSESALIGKRMVTAAAVAVEETRRRIDLGAAVGGDAGGPGERPPVSPPPALVKPGSAPVVGSEQITPAPASGSTAKRRKTMGGGSAVGAVPMSTGGTTPGDKDKSGKGLRHFSMKVCEKVESKHTTTYNEVADELVAEFSNPDDPNFCADQAYDEKNIRRRVYDALNVLMAMNIITKEKKEITWVGLPMTTENDADKLRAEKARVQASLEKKNAYLQELVEQYNLYQALLKRNAARAAEGVVPSGVELPFILVQTKPEATVEVEISKDQRVVHFDFNSTPFQIHDGNFVLANMNLMETSMAEMKVGDAEGGARVKAGGFKAGGVKSRGVKNGGAKPLGEVAEGAGAAKCNRKGKAEECSKRVGGVANGKASNGRQPRTTRGLKAVKADKS